MTYFADRVKDTTTTTGTGNITLANSAPAGFRTFATALGASPIMTAACILDEATGDWEVSRCLFNGTTTLQRVTVRASSNAGALVNFAAGTKTVFLTAPAEMIDNINLGFQYAMSRGLAMP